MIDVFGWKGPQKIAYCHSLQEGRVRCTQTFGDRVLSTQLLQTLNCSAIINPRFHNRPTQRSPMCNYSFICSASLNAKLNHLCCKLKVFLFILSANKENG